MRKLALLLLGLTLASSGCFGGGGGGGGISIPYSDFGGSIYLAGGGDGLLSAQFLTVEGGAADAKVSVSFGGDDCEQFDFTVTPSPTPTPQPTPTLTVTAVNVGASITAESGSSSLVATFDASFEDYYVQGTAASYPTGVDWTVENAGSPAVPAGTLATIRVPKPVVLTNSGGGLTVVPGQPLEVRFTPDSGANAVFIYAEDALGDKGYDCTVKADGSFTFSAAQTTFLGSGAFVDLGGGATYDVVTVNGKQVVTIGVGVE